MRNRVSEGLIAGALMWTVAEYRAHFGYSMMRIILGDSLVCFVLSCSVVRVNLSDSMMRVVLVHCFQTVELLFY